MTRLKGKVKSIPVTQVTEEMQVQWVRWKDKIYKVAIHFPIDKQVRLIELGDKVQSHAIDISELKTLVVEYKYEYEYDDDSRQTVYDIRTKQLPLKYSQWQSAIDNGEVDSEKEIEWEEFTINAQSLTKDWVRGAKIIPQKKKRMYSEEDMKQFGLWLGKNFKKSKNKLIDELFKDYENGK